MWDNDPIGYLEELFNRAKLSAAFLTLTRGEFREGSQVSVHIYLEAKQQFIDDLSLLRGQVLLVDLAIKEKTLHRSARITKLINTIRDFL